MRHPVSTTGALEPTFWWRSITDDAFVDVGFALAENRVFTLVTRIEGLDCYSLPQRDNVRGEVFFADDPGFAT